MTPQEALRSLGDRAAQLIEDAYHKGIVDERERAAKLVEARWNWGQSAVVKMVRDGIMADRVPEAAPADNSKSEKTSMYGRCPRCNVELSMFFWLHPKDCADKSICGHREKISVDGIGGFSRCVCQNPCPIHGENFQSQEGA
jgi:hypothetical protein